MFVSSFNSEDCFDWAIILFNSRICVGEYHVIVNHLCKPLATADLFYICILCVYNVNKHTLIYMRLLLIRRWFPGLA